MSNEHIIAIHALTLATQAAGAVPKLQELGLTPEAAAQLITHLSQIPAFRRNLAAQFDISPMEDLTNDRLVFLHIPKCGGTTLHGLLVDWYGENNLHAERHNALYFHSARDLATKTLFSGHFDYYATQLVPCQPKVITFLRDPRSRLVSLYNFHRAHRTELIEQFNLTLARWANMYDIDEYFANPEVRAHPAVNNSIARYLSSQPQLIHVEGSVEAGGIPVQILRDQAIANLATLDFIGLMEDYDTSVTRLAKFLGKPAPKEIGRARSLDSIPEGDLDLKRIKKQTPTDKTHALLDDLVREDEAVYDFAKTLYGSA